MSQDESVFHKAMNSVIEQNSKAEQSNELQQLEQSAIEAPDYQHYSEYAMTGQAPGTDGILSDTAAIAHLDSVHIGNEEDMDMGL